MTVVPVILAGGIGERFWPLSRSAMPKQLLKIISNKTMLEETLLRVSPFCSKNVKPLIVTSKAISSKFKKIFPSKLKYDLIIEPVGKNTAPAVAIAASWIKAKYGDSVMMVLSADHDIRPRQAFVEAARFAVNLALRQNGLVVFGIKPSRAETGYGYIQLGKNVDTSKNIQGFSVKRFIEKPTLSKAQKLVQSDKFMWNSGMFVWKTSVILEEFANFMPQLHQMVQNAANLGFSKDAIYTFYNDCPKESIDFGIMEHSKRVFAVVGDFLWDDIGSWESVSRVHPRDKFNSTVVGLKVYQKDSCDSIVVNKSSKAVAAIGLKNAVVVSTDDAVLVIDRSKLSDFKKYLNEMKGGALPSELF